ncbi:MAG: helix-turn-helix transcriptional regulator [Lachnospiraceae bacterium]|nr:helix-turn-helix transcriptional regulator [Lachnospiraceae bacterium]
MNTMTVIDMAATGKNITRLRKSAGITVRQMQDVFGFRTPQAIYKWQNGTSLPTVDNLVMLSGLFGVPIDDILIVIKKTVI